MPAAPPPIGTVENGYRYKGGPAGDPASWERVGAPQGEPATGWEAVGGRRMPDGSIVRLGPRGGLTVLQGPTGVSGNTTAGKLTEDQGKAQTYAQLQASAERNYQAARARGYDPTSIRNATASWFDGVPVLDGLAPIIRDEAADQGRQAEMQWTDAQLKAVSGAASPEAEVRRNVRTYFPAAGQDLPSLEPQMRGARRTAFESARVRAGPAGTNIVPPRDDIGITPQIRAGYRKLIEAGTVREGAPDGSRQRPYLAAQPRLAEKLPKGAFYLDGNLVLRQRGATPARRPSPPRPAPNAGWQVLSVE